MRIAAVNMDGSMKVTPFSPTGLSNLRRQEIEIKPESDAVVLMCSSDPIIKEIICPKKARTEPWHEAASHFYTAQSYRGNILHRDNVSRLSSGLWRVRAYLVTT